MTGKLELVRNSEIDYYEICSCNNNNLLNEKKFLCSNHHKNNKKFDEL